MTSIAPRGLLLIDKSEGYTSMDVCAIVRGRLRRAGAPRRVKVGHGGTLDPMATGLLVVMVGRATRLCKTVMAGEKEYLAMIDLSRTSTTDDREGEIQEVPVTSPPTSAQVEETLHSLTGEIEQRPPAYSAIKIDGKRAYDLARKGLEPVVPARRVVVHAIDMLHFAWPVLSVRVRCGQGVYIRSLARDAGTILGTGGMLTQLRRTRVGQWRVEDAQTLDELPHSLGQADLIDGESDAP